MGFLGANPYRELEKRIGYRFRRKRLLEEALVHRSFRFESKDAACDNQRLEFLGDAALGLAATVRVFAQYADRDEGFLTCVRSRLTSGKALAAIAERIGLGEQMRLGRGEEQSGGRRRDSNLADALEAVIGAAYLDGGMKAVEKVFNALFVPEIGEPAVDVWSHNPKGRLQQLCQKSWKQAPEYRVAAEEGPSHERLYTVEVRVGDRVLSTGTGRSKRSAETAAAVAALAAIGPPGEAEPADPAPP